MIEKTWIVQVMVMSFGAFPSHTFLDLRYYVGHSLYSGKFEPMLVPSMRIVYGAVVLMLVSSTQIYPIAKRFTQANYRFVQLLHTYNVLCKARALRLKEVHIK